MKILPSNRRTILNPDAQGKLEEGLNTSIVESMVVPFRPYERKILNQLVQGKDSSAIAKSLGVDRKYVSTVLSVIQKKTKMNLIELVVHFTKQGEFYHA